MKKTQAGSFCRFVSHSNGNFGKKNIACLKKLFKGNAINVLYNIPSFSFIRQQQQACIIFIRLMIIGQQSMITGQTVTFEDMISILLNTVKYTFLAM